MKTILFTGVLDQHPALKSFLLDKGWNSVQVPFIKREPVSFSLHNEKPSWVFFCSPFSVRVFVERQGVGFFTGKKIGALSQGTASALESYGLIPNYIGSKDSTQAIAEEYSELLDAKDSILFPVSNISLRTVQKQLEQTHDIDEVVVYETVKIIPDNIPVFEAVFITSPSNAEAFANIKIEKSNKFIFAFGIKTQERLQSFGISSILSKGFDEAKIKDTLSQSL